MAFEVDSGIASGWDRTKLNMKENANWNPICSSPCFVSCLYYNSKIWQKHRYKLSLNEYCIYFSTVPFLRLTIIEQEKLGLKTIFPTIFHNMKMCCSWRDSEYYAISRLISDLLIAQYWSWFKKNCYLTKCAM